MASKASGSRKLKKNTLPKFEADIYSGIPSGDLIVYSVHYLIEKEMKVTLEDIVSICFRLFPQKFGLKRFQKWPDSALVGRRWGEVRRNRYVTANANFEYNLTSKGSNLVKKVEKTLGIAAPKPVIKVKPFQPKKEPVSSVKEMQPSASKGKAVEPAKKVKTLKPKSPAVIKKKIEQLFQEEKVIPPALAQKAQPVRTKKADLAPAPVKQAQMPEIKVHPTPAKQTQPVQKEKATSPAPVKKIVPVRAKKATPAPIPVKQVQVAEIKKVRPVLAKQAQPAQKEKTTSPAPVKKIVLVRAKKVTPAPIKQVKAAEIKKVRPAPAKQTQPVQKEKVTSPAPVKKIRPVRTKRITPVLAPVKQVKAAEIKVRPAPVKQAQPVQKEKAAPPAPVKKIRSVRVKKTTPVLAPVKQVKAAEIKVHPTPVKQAQPVQAKKKQALPVSRSIEKTTPIQPSAVAPTSRAKEVPPIATPRVTKPVEPTIAQRIKKAQPQKADVIDTPVNVTKEQKERAGKFTRMMEKSDAYVHYKKHGDNSKINEFDFRSLLLCTMESSPETLAKNIKLFREYAGIHNRQDLVTFLVFCEDKFSYLLKPQNKSSRKVKK